MSASPVTSRHLVLTALVGLLSILATACSLPVAAQSSCDHEATRTATLSASDVDQLRTVSESGSLEIIGSPEATSIRVVGRACASSEELLRQVGMELGQSDGVALLEAKMPRTWGRRVARLDLVVEVPARLAHDIHDGSGSIVVRDVATVTIDDGSGSIDIERVQGNVEIDDGSGSIVASQIGGSVRIVDGSGSLRLEQVEKDVRIRDGSGDIHVETVQEDVRVTDGSGDIDVRRVKGDFIVEGDGSGSARYSEVKGTVRVPD